MPFVRPPQHDVNPAQTDPEQDIEHGPTKAGGEGHVGVAEAGDLDVCDEVAEGVADGEDGEAEDGVGDVADGADGLEEGDDLGGDGGDPGDGDGEAKEGDEVVVAWGVGGGGGEEEEGEEGEGEGEGEERGAEEGAWGEWGGSEAGPGGEGDGVGRGEALDQDEPPVPFAGGGFGDVRGGVWERGVRDAAVSVALFGVYGDPSGGVAVAGEAWRDLLVHYWCGSPIVGALRSW